MDLTKKHKTMKYTLTILLLAFFAGAKGQSKVANYKKVESIVIYKDAEIITYLKGGKIKSDTLLISQYKEINIHEVGETTVNDDKYLFKKRKP
jgi:hypothetical protein